jgi:hypothetical protein
METIESENMNNIKSINQKNGHGYEMVPDSSLGVTLLIEYLDNRIIGRMVLNDLCSLYRLIKITENRIAFYPSLSAERALRWLEENHLDLLF